MSSRRPVRLTLLIAVLAALCAGGVAWLPGVWESTLPFSEAVARSGGQWRTVSLPGRAAAKVVVSRNTKWCQCPGLAVAVQATVRGVDSVFATASALLKAFRAEAERGPGRCFTVHLQLGTGRHWPWESPTLYAFSWWYTKNGRWQHFGFMVPRADIRRAQALTGAWAA